MGPEITIFLLGTHWQEHHNWLWQDARNGHCLIKDLLAGTPKIDSGQIGAARNCHFLMWSLLAGAPELALARLGPEMVTFLLGASEQELQNRLWPDWGQKCSFYLALICRRTSTGSGQITRNGNFLISGSFAGASQLALNRLGPDMVIVSFGAYSQEHQNWLARMQARKQRRLRTHACMNARTQAGR